MTADYADLIRQDRVFVLLEAGGYRAVLVLKQEQTTLWIDNVAVHPDHQHRGLGRRLLAYAEQRARAARLAEVRLYTNEHMVENISLYRRLGYQEMERRAEAGFQRVFMRKLLPECRSMNTRLPSKLRSAGVTGRPRALLRPYPSARVRRSSTPPE